MGHGNSRHDPRQQFASSEVVQSTAESLQYSRRLEEFRATNHKREQHHRDEPVRNAKRVGGNGAAHELSGSSSLRLGGQSHASSAEQTRSSATLFDPECQPISRYGALQIANKSVRQDRSADDTHKRGRSEDRTWQPTSRSLVVTAPANAIDVEAADSMDEASWQKPFPYILLIRANKVAPAHQQFGKTHIMDRACEDAEAEFKFLTDDDLGLLEELMKDHMTSRSHSRTRSRRSSRVPASIPAAGQSEGSATADMSPPINARDDWFYNYADKLEPTLEFFYKPHTITALLLLVGTLVYYAMFIAHDDVVSNTKMGIAGCFGVILLTGLLEFKDGPFIRPHPAFWRLVLAVSVFYQLILVMLLFQDKHTARHLMTYLDPNLGVPLPEKSYAEDCSITWETIKDQMDVFVLAHTFGWFAKSLVLRDPLICWILSIMFEVMEYSLQHQLPNFAECWWDHWILDVLLTNWLGIYMGIKTCEYFEMKRLGYHAWMLMANVITETLICFKFGVDEFHVPTPLHVKVFWIFLIVGLSSYAFIQFFVRPRLAHLDVSEDMSKKVE
ncbi:hypothetical protein HDU82_008743 [Entophlyctis luteolus]|nr:hypothetical protein HDU82_008743 [Entophlyctis luteolus]